MGATCTTYQQLFISKDTYFRSHVSGRPSQTLCSQPGPNAGGTRRRGQCSFKCTRLFPIHSEVNGREGKQVNGVFGVGLVGAQQETPQVMLIPACLTDDPSPVPFSQFPAQASQDICISRPGGVAAPAGGRKARY